MLVWRCLLNCKYSFAAEDANIVDFSDVNILKYSGKVKKFLANFKDANKHLFVVTGNQGEPNATLSKIVYNKYLSRI